MQNTVATTPLSALEVAVLETIVYSDLFSFPLTPEEVWRALPVQAEHKEVYHALAALQRASLVATSASYVMLSGREDVAQLRDRRRQSSRALWRTAEGYGRLMGRLPFVRMVAVSGSLAFENANAGDDLDYLIVTAPGRVWLTRAMTMLLVRFGALRGVTVCPNYLLSETALELKEHDFYTARELRQMVPVAGVDVYVRMLAANAWWREYLPNAEPPAYNGPSPRRSLPRRAAEGVLRLRPFDRLEAWLLKRKGDELRQNAGPEAAFDETMCKGHFEGWRERTRSRVAERMRELLEAAT